MFGFFEWKAAALARDESDREDLMREATALKRRAELRVPGEPGDVTAGFRDTVALSIYFGQDPAYHFDPEGRLRRAYADGFLYRSQGTTLARLERMRSSGTAELRRQDLDAAELEVFLQKMHVRLRRLRAALESKGVEISQVIPADCDFLSELLGALDRVDGSGEALSPAVGVR